MARLDDLRLKVKSLYLSELKGRDEWADWLYASHILVVTEYAKEIAERVGANPELSQAAALLHDIADYKIKRANLNHEAESLKIARQLMKDFGFDEKEVSIVVDDAIRFHSCRGDERPKSKEGSVLATADALAHLKTDFYIFAAWGLGREKSLEETKDWVLKKIERDLNSKISFDDIREEARPDYKLIKELFSR